MLHGVDVPVLYVAVPSSGCARTGVHPVAVRYGCGGCGCSCCSFPFVRTCRLIDLSDCIDVSNST